MKTAWALLTNWRNEGYITDLEREFVRFLLELDEELGDEVLLAAAACISAQRNGNLCLDLSGSNEKPFLFDEPETGIELTAELRSDWLKALSTCSLVSNGHELQPLVLEERRLYLHRFWKYEEEFCHWIREKAKVHYALTDEAENLLKKILPSGKDLFEINWQEVALILSFLKDLVVITGGPGTGKTHTVLSIIAAHAQLHKDEVFHIALAAPTGKAARRLMESIEEGRKRLPKDLSAKVAIPETALTVHKLLGSDFRGSSFKYHENNPLPYDLVIIDEASMLDINLWGRLTKAIASGTKLIVLGDKDQLASVEAGSILGDLCQGRNSFSKETAKAVAKVTGGSVEIEENAPSINDCIVFLTKSYRFEEGSGIQKLAESINKGDSEQVISLLEANKYPDIKWLPNTPENISYITKAFGVHHYRKYADETPQRMQKTANEKKILCAIRRSSVGVDSINNRIESEIKREAGFLQNEKWYHGRPIMATKNDPATRIKNGEIGLYDSKNSTIRFEGEQNPEISPARIQHYEPAFAITVHKSQGSEFEDVAILLPNEMNSILSKEILYTSVTRARRNTLVVANKEILKQTVEHSVHRKSGVKQKIWGF